MRRKLFWGIIFLAVGLLFAIAFLLLKTHKISGTFFGFIQSLFPALADSPGQGIQEELRIAKFWQIILALPASLCLSIGLGLILRLDPRPFISRGIKILPTPWFLLALCVLFIAAASWLAYVPLEGVPHTGDDIAQVFQARILARGELTAPVPPVVEAFQSIHIIVRNGQWYSMYPIGHALLLTPFVVFHLEMLAGPLLGALCLLLIYGLARLFCGEVTSRVAAILYVLSPFALMISSSPVYHTSDLLLTLIFLWGMLRSRQKMTSLPALVAGLALGFTFAIRPALTVALCLAALFSFAHDIVRNKRKDTWWRAAWLIIGSLPGGILCLWANAVQNGTPLLFGYELLHPGQNFGFGSDKGYAPLYGTWGHTPIKALQNLVGNVLALSTTLQGWPVISLLPALLGFWAVKWKHYSLLFVGLIISIFAIQLFHWGSSMVLGPRYYFMLTGLLVIMGALGLRWLWHKGTIAATASTFALLLLSFQVATIYAPDALSDLSSSYLGIDGKVTRMSELYAEKPAVVFIRGYIKGYYSYQSGFLANSPWLDDEIIYAFERDPSVNQQVMEAFPNHNAYVFVCEVWDEQGKLYGFSEAPLHRGPYEDSAVQFPDRPE